MFSELFVFIFFPSHIFCNTPPPFSRGSRGRYQINLLIQMDGQIIILTFIELIKNDNNSVTLFSIPSSRSLSLILLLARSSNEEASPDRSSVQVANNALNSLSSFSWYSNLSKSGREETLSCLLH